MTDRVVRGRPPTPDELYWDAAAGELTPAKSLDRIDAKVGFVFGNISLIGTLVAGLGLVTGATSRLVAYDAEVRLVLVLLCAALALALVAAFPSLTHRLKIGRANEVRSYYTRRILVRGWLVIGAMVCFSAAFVLALAVTFVVVDHRTPPALSLQWRSAGGAPTLVGTLRAQVAPGAIAETRLTQLTGSTEGAVLVRDMSTADATGKLEVTATVQDAPKSGAYRLVTTVREGTTVRFQDVTVELMPPG